MSPATSRATPAGILFESSNSTPAYLSRNDHRNGARGTKNKWGIRPPAEYEVFASSSRGGFTCSNGHNWGIRQSFGVLGKDGEKIAKFPRPSNSSDERHGYPVSARDTNREFEHRPPAELTSRWRDGGLITEFEKARIDRGKI